MTPRFSAYARLVRLPNVFTALADVGLGLFAAGGTVSWLSAGSIAAASAALYCGGMVWNDYFDIDQDRRERPFRPLPSGAISAAAAKRLGIGLLTGGWLFAILAGHGRSRSLSRRPSSPAFSSPRSSFTIGGSNGPWLGPWAWGHADSSTCCSLVRSPSSAAVPCEMRVHLAAIVGIYIVGVDLVRPDRSGHESGARLRRRDRGDGCRPGRGTAATPFACSAREPHHRFFHIC